MPVPVVELLRRAVALVPEDARSDAGRGPDDVGDHLDHNEWEAALDLLLDFDGLTWQTVEYWDLLIAAAEEMRLDDDARWCHWRRFEARSGLVRAELQLVPAEVGGRRIPIPGTGVLRPMWNLDPDSDGRTELHIAALWVETASALQPGGHGTVRLLPLTPERWRHLAPGDRITMHEARPVAGTATIVQVLPPPS
ncbi:hypothetical protein [Saccharomonospora cyanea]|uniref:Uncharacterized protein n=1 Tax=Saccharomonospora cyanea NA-134 TaxID=882082 RepID=H5XCG7_9PSEU|nr:hypothetical protein [Saccharomonospora cyanea]EHR60182.1 hypothetical protein SaccyDRAFT_1273 [Saccharomonospora cyanea NA-134]